MWWPVAAALLLATPGVTSQKVKIGVVSVLGSDRRQSSEKFWSFGHDYSSSIILEPEMIEIPWWSTAEVGKAACAAAKRGARAIVLLSPPRLAPQIASYSDNLGLPVVTALTAGSPVGRQVVNLLPDTSRAAADLIGYLRWQSFAFIYDTDNGAEQLPNIMKMLPPHVSIDAFWRVYNAKEAHTHLFNLPSDQNRVILSTTESLADELFAKLASETPSYDPVLRDFYGMLLTPVGTVRRDTAPRGHFRLNKFSVVDEESEVLKDFENRWKTLEDVAHRPSPKELPDSALLLHDASKLLQGAFSHLASERPQLLRVSVPDNVDCFNYTSGFPSSVNLFQRNVVLGRGISNSLQFDDKGRRVSYSLNIFESTPFALRKVGSWSDVGGLRISESFSKANLAQPNPALQRSGPVYRVTSTLVNPFLRRNANGDLEGYVMDFLDELAIITGHQYRLQIVKDGKYGYFKNGKWYGMIGEIVNNETDMVVADLTKTPERAKVMYFSKTFMTIGLNLLMAKPPAERGLATFEPFSFLTVWPAEIWLVVVLGAAIFAAVGYGASRFVGAPDRIRALESKSKDSLSPCGSCWFTVGALLQRDAGIYPRSLTHRIWALLWWFFCFFMFVCYISSLTSTLIKTRSHITTTYSRKTSQELLQDFLQKGYPTVGTLSAGSTVSFFKDSTIGVYHTIGQHFKDNPDVLESSYAAGTKRVRDSNGSYVFVMESASSHFQSNMEPCDLLASARYITTRSYAPGLPKDSKIKDIVDHGVLTMMEMGTLRMLYEKWWTNFTSYCEDPNLDILPRVYSNSMTLHEVSGVFYILIVFVIVSAIAAFIEHYVKNKRISPS